MNRLSFNTLVAVILVLSSIVTISCSQQGHESNNTSSKSQAIKESQHWLDAGQPGKAIDILKPIWRPNEATVEQNQIQMVLASAYVQRSGVNLSQFIEFLKSVNTFASRAKTRMDDLNQLLDRRLSFNNVSESSQNSLLIIHRFYSSLLIAFEFIDLIDSLPTPIAEKRFDFNQAMFVLSKDNAAWTSGQYLYRSFLSLIFLQMNIQSKVYFSGLQSCSLNFDRFIIDLKLFDTDFTSLLGDIAKGLKKSKERESIAKFAAQTRHAFDEIYTKSKEDIDLKEIQELVLDLTGEEVQLCP